MCVTLVVIPHAVNLLVCCYLWAGVCQLCCVSTHWRPVVGSCRCVNCVVYPLTGDLCSGLVGVSIVLCIHALATCVRVLQVCQLCCVSMHWRPVFWSCRCVNCVVYPRTGDLFSGLVGMSIVLCIHALATCVWVLRVCQLCCVYTHWRPVFWSCRCVNCVVYPRTGDLFSGLVGVSIVLCIHALATCVWVLRVCQLCCVYTHWRPVSWSCRCVNCVVYPRTGDLCSGLAGVSIVLCIHALVTCVQVL